MALVVAETKAMAIGYQTVVVDKGADGTLAAEQPDELERFDGGKVLGEPAGTRRPEKKW